MYLPGFDLRKVYRWIYQYQYLFLDTSIVYISLLYNCYFILPNTVKNLCYEPTTKQIEQKTKVTVNCSL